MASALSAWINQNKVATATDHAVYLQVKSAFDRQNKCSTLRGYMTTRNYAVAQSDGSVTITIGNYSTSVAAGVVNNCTGGGSNAGGGSNNGGGSSTPTLKTLSLSASPAGAGTVTGAGQYAQGTSVNITATAASGYTFTKWSDNNTNASRSIVMNSDTTLQAIFTSSNPGGGDDNGGDDNGGGNNGF